MIVGIINHRIIEKWLGFRENMGKSTGNPGFALQIGRAYWLLDVLGAVGFPMISLRMLENPIEIIPHEIPFNFLKNPTGLLRKTNENLAEAM